VRRAWLVPFLVACFALTAGASVVPAGASERGQERPHPAASLDELTTSSAPAASELAPQSRSMLVGAVTARRELREHRARTSVGRASAASLGGELCASSRLDDVPSSGATPCASTTRAIRGPPRAS
jgi:hypothetical protein